MSTPITNSNDRFLEWYKKQYGKNYTEGGLVKTDAISDKDYETGNALYQGYLQKQNLTNQYNSATKQLDENTSRQRQEASILRDKMAKYLNLQNKNNGLNNLGVSESVGLQADSQYANNIGNIEANANAEKTSLFNNYLTNKTNIDSSVATNEQNILNKYQQFAREDEQKAYDRQQDEYNKQKYEQEMQYQREQDAYNKQKAEEELAYQKEMDAYNKLKAEEETAYQREQDAYERQKYEEELAYQKQQDEYNKIATKQQETFNEFMAAAESGTFNTASELESFYGTVKDNLSAEQQAIAQQYINFYKNNPDQQEIDKEVNANKPEIKENADGSITTTTDNKDGTVTEKITDKEGNVIEEKTKLKIDTTSGHSRYTSTDGSTISSPNNNAKFKITSGSNNNDHANNFTISYNDKTYKVEVGKEFAGTNDQLQEIYSYMKQVNGRDTIEEGDYVLYNGELYIASTTGRLWTIQDRSKFWAWNWTGKTASELKAEMQRDFG